MCAVGAVCHEWYSAGDPYDCRKAAEILREALKNDTGPAAVMAEARVANTTGAVLAAKHDAEGALERFAAARAGLESLIGRNPEDWRAMEELAIALHGAAGVWGSK